MDIRKVLESMIPLKSNIIILLKKAIMVCDETRKEIHMESHIDIIRGLFVIMFTNNNTFVCYNVYNNKGLA